MALVSRSSAQRRGSATNTRWRLRVYRDKLDQLRDISILKGAYGNVVVVNKEPLNAAAVRQTSRQGPIDLIHGRFLLMVKISG